MTEHSFDLAAALLDQAVERLSRRDYGITRILFHEFGDCILNANHTTHDTGHSVKMWAYDEHGILAAAQADAPHVGGTAQARIVTFRAGHLSFSAQRHRRIRRPRPVRLRPHPDDRQRRVGPGHRRRRAPAAVPEPRRGAPAHPRRPRTRRLNPPADNASRPPTPTRGGRPTTHLHAPRKDPPR